MRRLVWLTGISVFLFFSSLQAQQQRISLEECISRALEANYSIQVVRNQEQKAANDVTYAPFLPSLGIDAQQTQRLNDTKTVVAGENQKTSNARTDALSAGVSLNWRLFDGMAMFTTYARYREILAIGELNTQMSLENLVVNVSEAYYNVIVQHSKLDASKHSLELSTERFNEARDKYMLGVLSGLELQQAKIDLNADSSKYMKQRELLKSAYISLNMIMNADLQHSMYVQDTIQLREPLNYKELYDNTLSMNTSLQIARKDQKISALDVKLARSALFPSLDFNSGYNYSRTETPSSNTSLNRTNGYRNGFRKRPERTARNWKLSAGRFRKMMCLPLKKALTNT